MRYLEQQDNDQILDFKVPKRDELGVQETDYLTLFCFDDGQDGLSELALEAYNHEDQIQEKIFCIIFLVGDSSNYE